MFKSPLRPGLPHSVSNKVSSFGKSFGAVCSYALAPLQGKVSKPPLELEVETLANFSLPCVKRRTWGGGSGVPLPPGVYPLPYNYGLEEKGSPWLPSSTCLEFGLFHFGASVPFSLSSPSDIPVTHMLYLLYTVLRNSVLIWLPHCHPLCFSFAF